MKILITGVSGMLGKALWETLPEEYSIVGVDIRDTAFKFERWVETKRELEKRNITKQEEISKLIKIKKPDVVIHAAAYTDVDGCEQNSEQAHRVNVLGTQNVAQACKDSNCLLIYISTDFVFDGEKKSAYTESDRPNPINAYGKSKLEGEKCVQSISKNSLIVRSSWLFGRGGNNFVDTMLQKAKTEKQIKVVKDQFGSPTYTKDLAQAIEKLISLGKRARGIYHITNSSSCSWYEFALSIKEEAGLNADIAPISSKDYPSPTKRPKMSVLDNGRYQGLSDDKLPHWRDALKEYLAQWAKRY